MVKRCDTMREPTFSSRQRTGRTSELVLRPELSNKAGASLADALGAHRPLPRASLAGAACSTIVEWYDGALDLYFATVLPRGVVGPGEASLLVTLGGFAVAYL